MAKAAPTGLLGQTLNLQQSDPPTPRKRSPYSESWKPRISHDKRSFADAIGLRILRWTDIIGRVRFREKKAGGSELEMEGGFRTLEAGKERCHDAGPRAKPAGDPPPPETGKGKGRVGLFLGTCRRGPRFSASDPQDRETVLP